MILDDENVLMSDLQETANNHLNLIKLIRDNYGTFNRVEVTNTLFNIFDDILDDKNNPCLTNLLRSYGWFIDIINEHRVTITEHPRKCNGYPSQLFEIIAINTNNGLSYRIRFYEYTCSLSALIKSYMINKFKLIQVENGWVPERFKHEWILNI